VIEEWGVERVGDVAELLRAAMPGEQLSDDELAAVCWEDPGVVFAAEGGSGVCAVVTRAANDQITGWVRLLAVHPGARRQGVATALVDAAEEWSRGRAASQVGFGASAPFYLWPGIDTRWTSALCLAEGAGFHIDGLALNLSCPTTYRSAPPRGVVVRRLLGESDAAAVRAWCQRDWPWWDDELARGIEQACAFGAFADDTDGGGDGRVLGFACHSVNRAAWIGPMAGRAADGAHVPGTGGALLSELCRDLMVAGYPDAEIAWVSNVSFYNKTAGAQVSRVFASAMKRLA
jgi:mycothiol synthase